MAEDVLSCDSRPSLPTEILGHIASFLHPSHLNSLALVSPEVCFEAERLLYLAIDFPRPVKFPNFAGCLRTLAACPRRAGYVRDLRMPGHCMARHAQLCSELVHQAFRNTVNLECLHIRPIHTTDMVKALEWPTFVNAYTFELATFQLRILHCRLSPLTEEFFPFYASQPNIREWYFLATDSVVPYSGPSQAPDTILPQVCTVSLVSGGPQLLGALRGRHIERLYIKIPGYGADPQILSSFRHTLRHVSITGFHDAALETAIADLATGGPTCLESLTLHTRLIMPISDGVLARICGLTNLKTLILMQGSGASVNVEDYTGYYMVSCHSLTRFAIMTFETEAMYCFSFRRETKEIVFDGYDLLNGSSWRTLP